MEKSKERPRANVKSPILTESLETLKELLKIEKERLEIAVKIEKKRDIVFPETTVIIHDVMKLQTEIERRKNISDNKSETKGDFNFICDIDAYDIL